MPEQQHLQFNSPGSRFELPPAHGMSSVPLRVAPMSTADWTDRDDEEEKEAKEEDEEEEERCNDFMRKTLKAAFPWTSSRRGKIFAVQWCLGREMSWIH